jgi:hypothetical protein
MRSPTISGTSFARSQRPKRSRTGRSRVCVRSSSRLVPSLRCDHRRSYRHHERPGSTTSWQERREICALTTVPHPRFPAARPLRAPIQAESIVRSACGRRSDRNRPALARKGVPYGESRFRCLTTRGWRRQVRPRFAQAHPQVAGRNGRCRRDPPKPFFRRFGELRTSHRPLLPPRRSRSLSLGLNRSVTRLALQVKIMGWPRREHVIAAADYAVGDASRRLCFLVFFLEQPGAQHVALCQPHAP